MAARTFREKKEKWSRVFFDVIFDVYSHVDNREKELERVIEVKGDEFLWEKKTWKFHSGGEKWEMLAASKVKMRGSEKIKANMNRGNKIFGKHIRQFLLPARAAQIR